MAREEQKTVSIGTREIDGVAHEVFVAPDGHFSTVLDGDSITSGTLDGLLSNVRSKVRRRKVAEKASLPVSVLGRKYGYYSPVDAREKFRHGIVTGIHASNGNVLFREDGSKSQSEQISYSGSIFQRLSAEDVAEYVRLEKAQTAAREALEKWQKDYALDVKAELQKLEKAAGIEEEKR